MTIRIRAPYVQLQAKALRSLSSEIKVLVNASTKRVTERRILRNEIEVVILQALASAIKGGRTETLKQYVQDKLHHDVSIRRGNTTGSIKDELLAAAAKYSDLNLLKEPNPLDTEVSALVEAFEVARNSAVEEDSVTIKQMVDDTGGVCGTVEHGFSDGRDLVIYRRQDIKRIEAAGKPRGGVTELSTATCEEILAIAEEWLVYHDKCNEPNADRSKIKSPEKRMMWCDYYYCPELEIVFGLDDIKSKDNAKRTVVAVSIDHNDSIGFGRGRY